MHPPLQLRVVGRVGPPGWGGHGAVDAVMNRVDTGGSVDHLLGGSKGEGLHGANCRPETTEARAEAGAKRGVVVYAGCH